MIISQFKMNCEYFWIVAPNFNCFFSRLMASKKKFRWTQQQEILLLEEVSKRRILVDPSTSNNPKMREAAWEEVRSAVNVTFGLSLEREQVRKKYNDSKGAGKKKATMAVECGTKEDGRMEARNWAEFRRYGSGTGGGRPMYPPPEKGDNIASPKMEENFLLEDTPPTHKVIELPSHSKRPPVFVLVKPSKEKDEIGGMDEKMIGSEDGKDKAEASGSKRKLLATNGEEGDVETQGMRRKF